VKPKVSPKKSLVGCDLVRAEIVKYEGWNTNIMQAIAQAENQTCSPTNHNLKSTETHRRADGTVICIGSYGVLQVGCLHYRADEDRDDLATNVKVAHRVWKGSGYTPWTQYKNGEYLKYLK
jgi:hypothetical protein